MIMQFLLTTILLVLFSLTLVFHLLVLIKVIPYTLVWGGRLTSTKAMYRFEAISILINLLFGLVVLLKAGYVQWLIPAAVITTALWGMAAVFVLNTLGNLRAKNTLEKRIFTPVTLICAILLVLLLLN